MSDNDKSRDELLTELQTLRRRVAELRSGHAEDRRSAEQTLEHWVAAVMDYAILLLDPQGHITSWNAGAERLKGYRAEEIIGQHFSRFYPQDAIDRGWPQRELEVALAEGRFEDEGWRVRKDGSRFWANVVITALRDGGGSPRGFLKITRDLTERKQAEEDLARSNRDLEQFAYVASHDLQEPLRAVSGCVQVLQRRYKGQLDGRADELIAHTVDGVSRMQALISDLLAFSRIARGKAFEPTDSAAALGVALANVEVAVREAGAVVTHGPLPVVRADPGQLAQLFQNLVGNAVKFLGPSPPRVHVGAERHDGHWFFSVKDNGIGISPEYFERIFTVFQRLHTRDEYPGTGIGLAMCKRIVERHGGRIWLESEPGKGSTFFFTVPDSGANA